MTMTMRSIAKPDKPNSKRVWIYKLCVLKRTVLPNSTVRGDPDILSMESNHHPSLIWNELEWPPCNTVDWKRSSIEEGRKLR
ncbi:hypothetical protein BPIT_28840 [Candidatus Brocadia pituitae]|nr:hypothetical protein BPIT_28840 [Candidatus Brocadia pituitae]